MTNFTKTLITSAIILMGAAGTAQAADDTFKVVLKQDKSVSVEKNYTALKNQVRTACKRELKQAGYTRLDLTAGLQSKCQKELMAKVIDRANDFDLTLVHNETSGETIKTRAYAQN